jgi:SAM-dependent methyltransferase
MSEPTPDLPPEVFRADGTIDAARLIAAFDEAEHARRADRYFDQPDFATRGLAKPWGSVQQTDRNLYRLRAALQLLQPFRMARVLDFGCGLGWLARVLARLEMRVLACDVAPTALRIAEAYTRGREPDLAERISWHLLAGARIPLADGAADRILCFDALHHVPDQGAVLAEMARVLAPGGIAVFVEPGERHSASEDAQSEMRAHGVVENDIDIFAVARLGAAHGLEPGEVALTAGRVPTLSFERFAADLDRLGRRAAPDPALVAQVFGVIDSDTEVLRIFSLRKGAEPPDSRALAPAGPAGAGAAGRLGLRPGPQGPGGVEFEIDVENLGPFRWLGTGEVGLVKIGVMWRSADGALVRDWRRLRVPEAALQPGGKARFRVTLPPPEGAVAFVFDLVAEHVCWFGAVVELPIGRAGSPV